MEISHLILGLHWCSHSFSWVHLMHRVNETLSNSFNNECAVLYVQVRLNTSFTPCFDSSRISTRLRDRGHFDVNRKLGASMVLAYRPILTNSRRTVGHSWCGGSGGGGGGSNGSPEPRSRVQSPRTNPTDLELHQHCRFADVTVAGVPLNSGDPLMLYSWSVPGRV